MDGAKTAAIESGKFLDRAKPLLDGIIAGGTKDKMIRTYMEQYAPLRLQSHQLIGQIHAGVGDWNACEAEFRLATERFPNHTVGWRMLQRALEGESFPVSMPNCFSIVDSWSFLVRLTLSFLQFKGKRKN